MRLTSLTLQGFKSFGNRITIEFAPGVTAIVGPNGSGKSNVIDALKWTSGGGRAREFRATDQTDLIFHGAAGKRALGLAEVEVELTSGRAGVKIYRSLDKEGTTRLRLNGRAARFLDVEEALAGSGLGRGGIAIIGQGEVSQILMADPAKLLEYVAEAAGVARLKGRREQSSARLAAAAQHLERLQEILTELTERTHVLTEEAASAVAHTKLSAEALTLKYTAASSRTASLREEVRELEARQALLNDSLIEGRFRLTELRAAGKRAGERRDEAEERYRAAAAELEFRRGNLKLAEERLLHASERATHLKERRSAVMKEAGRLSAVGAPREPTVRTQEARAAASEAQARVAERAREVASVEARERSAAAAANEARERAASAERLAAELLTERRALTELRERLGEELLSAEAAFPPERLTALEAESSDAERAAAAAAERLEAAREELQASHERHAHLRAEAAARRQALVRQRAAFEARRGYAQGPRNALTAGIPGVIGSVADLVTVSADYQEAVAGALGRRAEYVVVETARTAERVLAHVRKAGGFVTLLPLDLMEARPGAGLGRLEGEPGVLASASDVISVDKEYQPLFDWLLGRTAVVESISAATRLARRFRERPRLVTLSGELLETSGAMSGGQRGAHAAVLGAAAELEEAEASTSEAEREAQAAAEAFAYHQQNVLALTEELRELEAARSRAAARLAAAREERAGLERLAADLKRRLEEASKEEVELKRRELSAPAVSELAEGAERLGAEHEALKAELDAARRAAADARVEAAEATQGARLAEERWRTFNEAALSHASARARLSELRGELADLESRVAEARRELTEAELSRELAAAAVPNDLTAEEAELAEARSALTELEEASTLETEAQARRAQELEEARLQHARRETALELAAEELSGFPEGLAALPMSERAARARLRSVEAELEALGAVNHLAATELAALKERKETLEVEAVQATLAVAELEAALARIDKETTRRLGAAISALKVAFDRHIRQLFGAGGRGGIEVELEEQRPRGLKIHLKPPGKQTQSLHLLSVGERTMGALAFLFALMGEEAGGGLPLAVLDEVDAPLDEANIRRFGEFVSRLAKGGTQFVLITHQKATFEIADSLYGVTSEQGVSRVFSIRRDEEGDHRSPGVAGVAS